MIAPKRAHNDNIFGEWAGGWTAGSPPITECKQDTPYIKFELPKQEMKIADVFHAVESAKSRFSIYAWGLVDTTMEDVFIKVAKGAQAFSVVA